MKLPTEHQAEACFKLIGDIEDLMLFVRLMPDEHKTLYAAIQLLAENGTRLAEDAAAQREYLERR